MNSGMRHDTGTLRQFTTIADVPYRRRKRIAGAVRSRLGDGRGLPLCHHARTCARWSDGLVADQTRGDDGGRSNEGIQILEKARVTRWVIAITVPEPTSGSVVGEVDRGHAVGAELAVETVSVGQRDAKSLERFAHARSYRNPIRRTRSANRASPRNGANAGSTCR